MLAEVFDIVGVVSSVVTLLGAASLMIALGAWRRGLKSTDDAATGRMNRMEVKLTTLDTATAKAIAERHSMDIRIVMVEQVVKGLQ